MNLRHISREKVEAIIQLAQTSAAVRPQGGSISIGKDSDVQEAIRKRYSTEPSEAELRAHIASLAREEMAELYALMVIGRGDNGTKCEDWEALVAEKINGRDEHLASYISEKAPLHQYLSQGLTWLDSQQA